jgi:hypothetical protein
MSRQSLLLFSLLSASPAYAMQEKSHAMQEKSHAMQEKSQFFLQQLKNAEGFQETSLCPSEFLVIDKIYTELVVSKEISEIEAFLSCLQQREKEVKASKPHQTPLLEAKIKYLSERLEKFQHPQNFIELAQNNIKQIKEFIQNKEQEIAAKEEACEARTKTLSTLEERIGQEKQAQLDMIAAYEKKIALLNESIIARRKSFELLDSQKHQLIKELKNYKQQVKNIPTDIVVSAPSEDFLEIDNPTQQTAKKKKLKFSKPWTFLNPTNYI